MDLRRACDHACPITARPVIACWIILGTLLALSTPVAWGGNPSYTVDSIVNTATQTPNYLAPNGLATIYGTELALDTSSVSAYSQTAGSLPTSMHGVSVVMGGLIAGLIYVSPTQINFVVPYELAQGTFTIFVGRNSLAGPLLKVQVYTAAPAFFTWRGNLGIAVHLDGSLISPEKPAKAGEIVILFVTGLGRVSPDTGSSRIANVPVSLYPTAQLQVVLGGIPVPAPNILYAGLAPNYAGLYQVNVRLPTVLPVASDVRVVAYGQNSPGPVILPLDVPAPPPVQIAADIPK